MPGGQPTKYKDDFPERARAFAEQGLYDWQMAENFGVHVDTFVEYKKRYPEFADAIKKGREAQVQHVENALLKNCLGYDYEEVTTEIKYSGNKEYKTVKKVKKHHPASYTAQFFFLVNRGDWRSINNVLNINDNSRGPSAKEFIAAVAKSTLPRYAIPVANGAGKIQDSSRRQKKRKNGAGKTLSGDNGNDGS